MKDMLKLIMFAFAILWGVVSCAPKAIIVEPVTPHAVRARAEVKAASDSAKRVSKSVAAVNVQAKGIAAEVNRATAEVERLKNLPTVAPDEFAALWLLMTDLKTSSWAHEIKVGETAAETVEQERLQEAAGKSMEVLEATAMTHDKSVEALKTQMVKQAEDAVLGRYAKRTFWIATVAAIFCVTAYLVIRFGPGIARRFIKPI
jgi:hypothetical protein